MNNTPEKTEKAAAQKVILGNSERVQQRTLRSDFRRQLIDIMEVAQRHSPEAIEKIVHIMRTSEDMRLVLLAAQYIVDRGFGKPAQAVNVGDHKGGPLKIEVNIVRSVENP